ncbi:MAG: hypothetical protein LAT53_03615 [Idiomarina sp.]|nr:hypothetical protein [Idiomarina sp.]
MANLRSNHGFSFIELTVVLGLVSGLLLILSATMAHIQQQRLMQVMVDDLLNLKIAVYSAQLAGENAATVADLQASKWYMRELSSPWGEPYHIEYRNSEVVIRGNAGIAARASGVAHQLPASTTSGDWVELFVAKIIHERPGDAYLHRQQVAGSPQLNTMETDLQMQNFNINDIHEVHATTIVGEHINGQQANFNAINSVNVSAEVIASDSLATDYADVLFLRGTDVAIEHLQIQYLNADAFTLLGSELFADKVHANNVFAEVINAGIIEADNVLVAGNISAEQAVLPQIQAEQVTADLAAISQLTADIVNAEHIFSERVTTQYMASNHLSVSGTFTTDALVANHITASDFITPTGSLSQLQTMLSNYQQLWNSCIATGSCE